MGLGRGWVKGSWWSPSGGGDVGVVGAMLLLILLGLAGYLWWDGRFGKRIEGEGGGGPLEEPPKVEVRYRDKEGTELPRERFSLSRPELLLRDSERQT